MFNLAIQKGTDEMTRKFVPFTLKAASDGYTYIEGVANKAVVDRGNDLIDPKAWDLKNYTKNPVILYNHDRDKIIGRAVEVKPQEDGLYIKCRISKSRDGMVSYVRDMIEEGMINAFSVGFASKDAAKSKDGVNTITAAELYEVSVVSIPMNQDSIFTVTMKDLAAAGSLRDVRRKFLEAKAASEKVLQVQDMLDAMENLGADREECILGLCEACGLTREEMRDVLSGDAGEASDELVTAAQKMLDTWRGDEQADDTAEAKSVAVPGNGSEMTVQTDVQAILQQHTVLLASLIGEIQKVGSLLSAVIERQDVAAAAESPEPIKEPAKEPEAAPPPAPEAKPEPPKQDGPCQACGKVSDSDELTHKMVAMKLAQIKATLQSVRTANV